MSKVIGNIGDAERRFMCDGAYIWWAIASEHVLVNPEGERVRLVADPEKRYESFPGGGKTTWLVEEVPA